MSCGGVYDTDHEGGYYHVCPPGTDTPRNENIDPADPKGKAIKAGGKGCLKTTKPEPVEVMP